MAGSFSPVGLQLTDQMLLEAAQQQVGGLELLAEAVLQQQQQQQLGCTRLAGVSPLLQAALLGSEDKLAAEVSVPVCVGGNGGGVSCPVLARGHHSEGLGPD